MHTACYNCGKELLELKVSQQNGALFSFIPKAELSLESVGKTTEKIVCSHACARFTGEQWKLPVVGSLRNSSNRFPVDETGSDPVAIELIHYGNVLVRTENIAGSSAAASASPFRVAANTFIRPGAVLCAVTGKIQDIEMEGQNSQGDDEMKEGKEEEHKEGGDASAAAAATKCVNFMSAPQLLLTELGLKKTLLIDSISVASSLRFAEEGEPANASIVAQYSLTLADGSPLRKKKVLAPGAIVIVAEIAINPGDAIVVALPPRNDDGKRYVPRPADLLATPVDSSPSSKLSSKALSHEFSDGYFRLPGDISKDNESGGNDEGNSDGDSEGDNTPLTSAPTGDQSDAINKVLQHRLSSEAKEACSALLNAGLLDGSVLQLSVFRETILLPDGLPDASDDTEISKHIKTLKKGIGKTRLARIVNKQSKLCATLPGEVSERDFSTREKKEFDLFDEHFEGQEQLVDPEWLKKHAPQIVLCDYCSLWDCVVTDEESRNALPAAAQIIASFPFSAFFDTNDLFEGPFPASTECKKSWIPALRCILTGPVLKKQLERMKDARKVADDFNPAVFVESLCALYKEFLDDERGLSSNALRRC